MLGRALNPCQPPPGRAWFFGVPFLSLGTQFAEWGRCGTDPVLCWVLRERLLGVWGWCWVCSLLEIVRREEVVLRAVLTTHHHWDHARGNEELARLCPGLRVYGADERIGALTHKVAPNEELTFGAIHVRCLFTPCHTSGHMCYFMWEDGSPDAPALFSGTPTLLPRTPHCPPHPHPTLLGQICPIPLSGCGFGVP
uniref:Metallo-beta-lactamase domain-containing protein n=1 Tax=Anas platyrhynchos platyrhynchos TaxID=8840 RepID=U3J9I8_ANAPP